MRLSSLLGAGATRALPMALKIMRFIKRRRLKSMPSPMRLSSHNHAPSPCTWNRVMYLWDGTRTV